MLMTLFDGQQEGERVLYEITTHPLVERFAVVRIIVTSLIITVLTLIIGSQTNIQAVIYGIGLILALLVLSAGLWWTKRVYADTRAFVTDRRIMRFERVSPFIVAKRALFWNEALKAKSFETNLLLKGLKIGTLIIEPQVQTEENVIIRNVHYVEDLANYIDKILFTFKNNPQAIGEIKAFVARPRGQRDSSA